MILGWISNLQLLWCSSMVVVVHLVAAGLPCPSEVRQLVVAILARWCRQQGGRASPRGWWWLFSQVVPAVRGRESHISSLLQAIQ
jgi:hypothetical protein